VHATASLTALIRVAIHLVVRVVQVLPILILVAVRSVGVMTPSSCRAVVLLSAKLPTNVSIGPEHHTTLTSPRSSCSPPCICISIGI
jgi:hypothetical protein